MLDEYEDIGEAYEELSKINETQQKEIKRLRELLTDWLGSHGGDAKPDLVDRTLELIEKAR